MKKVLTLLVDSAVEIKKVRTMTALALLSAMYVVLHMFVSIPITPLLQIRFSFIPEAIAGMFFGPIGGMLVGLAGDLLSFVAKPTGVFFPGVTFNEMLKGFLFGMLLYRQWIGFANILCRVIVAKLLCTVLVELIFTPLWLSILMGKAYLVVLQGRIIKTMVFFPIDATILFATIRLIPSQIKTRYSSSRSA